MAMKISVFCVLLLNIIINKCTAIIYHLNDSDYDRMPSLFDLDDYDVCFRENNGMYCLLELDLHGEPDNQIFSMIKGYSEHRVKHYDHSYIQRGVCVQKTCRKFIGDKRLNNSAILNKVLEQCVNDIIWNKYGVRATIKELNYCEKSEDVNHIDTSDWVVAGIFAAILVTNILGSVYDVIIRNKSNSKGNPYLLSFSVFQNWQWLTTVSTSEPRIDNLKGLHGFRTISIFMMISSHVMWVDSMGFTKNSHDFEKGYESILYQLIFNGMMIIQIFLVMSAFLLVYNLLIRSEKQEMSWKMYPQMMFMRWWRLTPAYAVTLAFTSTWFRHLGSGPLWRLRVTDGVAAGCRTYWWTHLLYFNNYVASDKYCAIQTWYIGAEMQVFAISLLLFLIIKSRLRTLALSCVLIVGAVAPALHVYFQDLDGIVIMEPEFFRKKLSKTFDVHVLGHNYLSCYAIGMGTACYLYHLQKNGVDKKKNKILRVVSWCFFPAMFSLFMAGQGFYADAPRAHLVVHMIWAVGHRLIMSGMGAFAIVSLVMRFSELYCSVFESPMWVVPSRLCYCVYLVHGNFLYALMGSRAYLTQVSLYNMVIVHFAVAAMSFVIALPLYLMVEGPAARLMKIFTTR